MVKIRYEHDWDRRNVDYGVVHGNSDAAYGGLIESIGLRQGMRVADLMCGYGEASNRILRECKVDGINIDLFLLESSAVQISRLEQTLKLYGNDGHSINIVCNDIRDYLLPEASLDRIIIKMGLHEIPYLDQRKLLVSCSSSLVKGGELYIWHAAGDSDVSNDCFQTVVRKKDEIAGFSEMVRDRCFLRSDDIAGMMQGVGLDVSGVYRGDFRINKNYLGDFGGDTEKINRFNYFVRTLMVEPLKSDVEFLDDGDSVNLRFSKRILLGRK